MGRLVHMSPLSTALIKVFRQILCDYLKALLTRNGGEWVNVDQDKGPLYDPDYIDLLSISEWSKIINIIIFTLSIAALIFRPRKRNKPAAVTEN